MTLNAARNSCIGAIKDFLNGRASVGETSQRAAAALESNRYLVHAYWDELTFFQYYTDADTWPDSCLNDRVQRNIWSGMEEALIALQNEVEFQTRLNPPRKFRHARRDGPSK